MTIDIPPPGTRGTRAPPGGALGRALGSVALWVHRRTGNKMGGQPLLYLHTVGAKTREPRTTPVMAFPDGENAWLIVASRGGTAANPAWLYNLAAHPDQVEIEVNGHRTAAAAETLSGEQRAVVWQRITAAQPRFAGYERKTDRELPIVRLTVRS